MRVLVTGATGFVASHLVPALASAGHRVIAVGHDVTRLPEGDGIQAFEADLRERTSLPDADAVVHLAQANVAFPDGARDLFAVNTASTAALLEHARACGARRFVFASSASVYGFGDGPFLEGDAAAASDFYSATKLASERLVAAYGTAFATTSLRLVAPYGPGQRHRLVPRLIDRIRAGEAVQLSGGGRPRMNPIYVGDVVRTITLAVEEDVPPLLNVGGDDVVSIRELAEVIGEAVGTAPAFEETPGGAPGDLAVDTALLKTFLAHPLVALRDGVRRTVGAVAPA